jgi:hypothetical protein
VPGNPKISGLRIETLPVRPAGIWATGPRGSYGSGVTTLRSIHKYMNQRLHVRLADGRVGKIVRVDTTFPANDTLVTLWTDTPSGPGVTKVRLDEVVGSTDAPKLAGG